MGIGQNSRVIAIVDDDESVQSALQDLIAELASAGQVVPIAMKIVSEVGARRGTQSVTGGTNESTCT